MTTTPAKQKRTFDPNGGLGFMRFFQFCCVLTIISELAMLLFVQGSTVDFTFGMFLILFDIITNGICVWLVANRMEYARWIIIFILALNYTLNLIDLCYIEEFSLVYVLINSIYPAMFILYFATSRRAKAVLVRPFSQKSLLESQRSKEKTMWDPKSKAFWMRILIYFFMFSVVGHWMEATFVYLVATGVVPGNAHFDPNAVQFRDYLNPFFIYGIGFCLCALVIYPIKEAVLKACKGKQLLAFLVTFLVAIIIVTAAEFALGMLANTNYTVWDYRTYPLNFMGQVCLPYSAMFATVALLMTYVVYPLLEHLFSYVREDHFRIIFVVSLVLFLILMVTYNIDLNTLFPGVGLNVDADFLDGEPIQRM